MSKFYSLDDEDDDVASSSAGPSRLGDGLGTNEQSSIRSSSPFAQNGSQSNKNVAANPISALLDDNDRSTYAESSAMDETRYSLRGEDDDAMADRRRYRVSEPPVVELRRAWTNERASPVILPWHGHAVDGVCSQIEEQMQIIDSLGADETTAEEEHVRLALVELDVERARWLVRSYLRCRIAKIEQHATFVHEDALTRQNLSELERGYAAKYSQICTQHYMASVLDFLPDAMRSLDDKAVSGSGGADGRGDMVTQPDLDQPVFVLCRQDCGKFHFPGDDLPVAFTKGSIHFVRFRAIQHLIASAKVELL